jgi:hypothetical protein
VSAAEIAGRYQLESRLGFGGMSTVHLAFDRRLERQVAVKLLAEHLAEDPTFVSRFQREAQAAARLVHPNIVQVFDSGLDEHTGQHFIVMEYIEGHSCAEILRDHGWVEVPEGVSIVEQACEGLHYAHRHGVVHRDVKPGNLLRSREGVVKLADFGIAKATEQSSITQVGSVLGTAAYLAPEQARGEEAGPSADLYALGVVAYQLVSGRLPYEAASLTELALKQQQEEPPMLDTLVAAVGPELADAVAIALALDPRERYRNAREMGHAVSDAEHGISPAGHLAAGAGGPAAGAGGLVAGAGDRSAGAGGPAVGAGGRAGGASASPAGARARHATAATSLLAAGTAGRDRGRYDRGAPARGGGVVPRQPRPGPVGADPRRAEPVAAATPRRRGSAGRRIFGALFALLLIVVAIVAIVISSAPITTKITLRRVVYNDVEKTSSALQQLVEENVK